MDLGVSIFGINANRGHACSILRLLTDGTAFLRTLRVALPGRRVASSVGPPARGLVLALLYLMPWVARKTGGGGLWGFSPSADFDFSRPG